MCFNLIWQFLLISKLNPFKFIITTFMLGHISFISCFPFPELSLDFIFSFLTFLWKNRSSFALMIKKLFLLFVFLCWLSWPEMFVSPLKFILRCLILSVMVFRTEEFGRWLVCEGGAFMRGISALMGGDIKEFVSSLCFSLCITLRRWPSENQERGFQQTADLLTPWSCPSLQNCKKKKKCLLF